MSNNDGLLVGARVQLANDGHAGQYDVGKVALDLFAEGDKLLDLGVDARRVAGQDGEPIERLVAHVPVVVVVQVEEGDQVVEQVERGENARGYGSQVVAHLCLLLLLLLLLLCMLLLWLLLLLLLLCLGLVAHGDGETHVLEAIARLIGHVLLGDHLADELVAQLDDVCVLLAQVVELDGLLDEALALHLVADELHDLGEAPLVADELVDEAGRARAALLQAAEEQLELATLQRQLAHELGEISGARACALPECHVAQEVEVVERLASVGALELARVHAHQVGQIDVSQSRMLLLLLRL